MGVAVKECLLGMESLDSVLLLFFAFLSATVALLAWAVFALNRFKSIWKQELSGLVCSLNQQGLEVVCLLLDIAMVNADQKAARQLGMITKKVKDKQKDPNFFRQLPLIIGNINDNNQNLPLGRNYANVRDAITNAIELIRQYSNGGKLDDFAEMVLEVRAAEQALTDSLEGLKRVFYTVEPAGVSESFAIIDQGSLELVQIDSNADEEKVEKLGIRIPNFLKA
jgi:hypothetical protein